MTILQEEYQNYAQRLHEKLLQVEFRQIERAVKLLESAYLHNKTVFVCGNGGSAAISEHFVCDHSKGIAVGTGLYPRVTSLVSNVPLITAIANDISYEDIFVMQLELQARVSDVLFVISSSGNSPNIVKALQWAKERGGLHTIAMVGFDGGQAKDLAEIAIHVPIDNYGIVEDAHQAIMHIISQHLRKKHDSC